MMDHSTFLRVAALFEAALAAVAVLLGSIAGVQPTGLVPDFRSTLVGVGATAPLVLLYVAAERITLQPFRRIHHLLMTTLGYPLSRCRWHELALTAALAGVCEELLFRGVLEPWLGRLGGPAGWIGASLLFGLAHAVTPTYFVLATAIGAYLSGVQHLGGGLVAPVIAHALYDWYAFVQIAKDYRRIYGEGPPPGSDGSDDATA
jgi:hypothetical protein